MTPAPITTAELSLADLLELSESTRRLVMRTPADGHMAIVRALLIQAGFAFAQAIPALDLATRKRAQ